MSLSIAKRIYLHAITPVHSGTGRSSGIVDLPVAREKSTGWPVIPGSSLKGVLRDAAEAEQADTLFGKPPKDDGSAESGRIALSDLRILCLPVRSFHGTFAWVTSPLALRRYVRDSAAVGAPVNIDAVPDTESTSALVCDVNAIAPGGKLYLEDLDFMGKPSMQATAIARVLEVETGAEGLTERFAVVADTTFSFLCETATEVAARVKLLDDVKTVQTGGLWWEEAVPAETLFYGWARESRPDRPAIDDLARLVADNPVVSIGGNTTVGRGLCRLAAR